MVARLGFAIATEQRPDVLLMDEVLAVGDQAFQAKCKERFETFRANGTAIVLVSHDQRLVAATCQRVVWLERGEVCRDRARRRGRRRVRPAGLTPPPAGPPRLGPVLTSRGK